MHARDFLLYLLQAIERGQVAAPSDADLTLLKQAHEGLVGKGWLGPIVKQTRSPLGDALAAARESLDALERQRQLNARPAEPAAVSPEQAPSDAQTDARIVANAKSNWFSQPRGRID